MTSTNITENITNTGKTETKLNEVFVSIDIEASGRRPDKNSIISIGYCIGGLDGKTISKDRISLKPQEKSEFDKNTLNEFWSKQLDKLKIFQDESLDIIDGLEKFMKIVNDLEDKYKRVHILCDNPAFDIHFIDYYLAKYLDKQPLSYTKNNKFRSIMTAHKYIFRTFDKFTYDKTKHEDEMKKYKINKDHYPENDAEYNYYYLISLINIIGDK